MRQVDIQAFRSSGPGGQYMQKSSTAVRAVHLPTGITAVCQSETLPDTEPGVRPPGPRRAPGRQKGGGTQKEGGGPGKEAGPSLRQPHQELRVPPQTLRPRPPHRVHPPGPRGGAGRGTSTASSKPGGREKKDRVREENQWSPGTSPPRQYARPPRRCPPAPRPRGAAAVGREKTAMGTAGFGAGTPGVLHLIFQF